MFTKDNLNKAIFVLLGLLGFGASTLSGAEILAYKAPFIFFVELGFIFLYTAINPIPPLETIKSRPLVAVGLLIWMLLFLLNFVYGEYTGDRSPVAAPYPYMAFHAIFVVYAIAVFEKMQALQVIAYRNPIISLQKRERVLFYILCALTFSVALSSSSNSFTTANIVMGHELVFIMAYIFVLISVPGFSKLIKNNIAVSILLSCWFLIVTISFFTSPNALTTQVSAVDRYYQMFIHLVFFVFLYQFLSETVFARKNEDWLLCMIPLSALILSIVFIGLWFTIEDASSVDWFLAPPLNQHIRHTGFIVAAASVISMVFTLQVKNSSRQMLLYSVLMLVSTSFVFWTGGRAASLSVVFTFALLVAYLAYAKNLKLIPTMLALIVLVLGIFVAESVKVFDWNGVIDQSRGSAGALVVDIPQEGNGAESVLEGEVSVVIREAMVEKSEPDRSLKMMSSTQVPVEFVEVEEVRVRSDAEIALNLFVTGRLEIWSTVLESLDGHWLLGLGPQAYYLMPNRIVGVQAHNGFLQFLLEWGVIGTTFFLLLMLWALFRIFSLLKKKAPPASISLLSGVAVLISLTLYGQVEGTYFHGQPVYYMLLALAVCLSTRKSTRGQN